MSRFKRDYPSNLTQPLKALGDCIDHGRKGKSSGYTCTRVLGKSELLHRAVYANFHKLDMESLKGMVIMHACDNPRCINPAHLALGTVADNNRDRDLKGRGKPRFKKGVSSGMGEANHRATVTDLQAIQILKLRDQAYTVKSIAEYLGVSSHVVRHIVAGENFKHLDRTGLRLRWHGSKTRELK